ncbi:MAG: PAS domain-containing protein [Alphaproteobacteria bacterium]
MAEFLASPASHAPSTTDDLELALERARTDPQAVVLHAGSGDVGAVERVVRARRALPYGAIVLLCEEDNEEFVHALLAAGADECVVLPRGMAGEGARAIARARVRRQALLKESTESELRLAAIHANLPGLVFRRRMTPDGALRYDYVSPSPVLLKHGHRPNSELGAVLSRTVPEDREPLMAAIRDSADDLSPFDFTRRVIAAGGNVRWMRSIATPHREPGGDVVWDGIVLDVTDQRQAEMRLKESEDRLAGIAANMPGDVFRRVLHPDGRITFNYVSPKSEELYGIHAASIEEDSKAFIDALHPEDRARWMEEVQRSARTLEHFDVEVRVRGMNGRYRWVRSIATTRRGEAGTVIWDGVTLDVDAIRSAQQALTRSESRMRNLAANLPGAVLQLARGADGRFACTFVSEGIAALIGHMPADIEGDGQILVEAIVPDDRPSFEEAIEEAARAFKPASWSGRIRARDGAVKWVDAAFQSVRDADGSFHWDGLLLDATERQRVERELQDREIHIANIAKNIPGIIYQRVLHRDGTVSYPYVSPGVKAMYGFEADEIMRDASIFPSRVVEEDRPLYDAEIARSARTMTPRRWEGRERMRDGTVLWVQIFGQPRRLENGDILWDGLLLDVTDRRNAELALEESEARLRSITDNLPGNVYRRVRHEDGRVSYPYVSWGLLDKVGIDTKSEFADPEKYLSLFHPEDFERLRMAYLHSGQDMAPLDFEGRLILPSGEVRWVNSMALPRRLPNGEIVWDGLSLDVTERKVAEEATIQAREAAEQASAAKSIFLANVSHELRTPLNAILGFSEVMRDELHGPIGVPEYAEYVRLIHSSGRHLLEVISDILDMSKIEAGRYVLRLEACDSVEIVEGAMSYVASKAEERQVELRSDLPAGLLPCAMDRRAARQVFLNLLSNAIKFTNAGGVVAIGATMGEPGYLDITVTDTGIGIPQDQLSRVAEPFQQVDASLTRQHEGTGLGLAISKRLMELHGGALGIASEEGLGTVVTVRFPLA